MSSMGGTITQAKKPRLGKQTFERIYDKAIKNGEWHGKGEETSFAHCLSVGDGVTSDESIGGWFKTNKI